METLPYWRLWGFLRFVVRLALLIKKKNKVLFNRWSVGGFVDGFFVG